MSKENLMAGATWLCVCLALLAFSANQLDQISERDAVGVVEYENGISCFTTVGAIYCAKVNK